MAGVAMSEPKHPSCPKPRSSSTISTTFGCVGAGVRERVVAGDRVGDREPGARLGVVMGAQSTPGAVAPLRSDRSAGVDDGRRREPAFHQGRGDVDQALVVAARVLPQRVERVVHVDAARTPPGCPSPARRGCGSATRTGAAPRAPAARTAARCCRMPMVATSASAWASTSPASSSACVRAPRRFSEPMTWSRSRIGTA